MVASYVPSKMNENKFVFIVTLGNIYTTKMEKSTIKYLSKQNKNNSYLQRKKASFFSSNKRQ